MSETGENFLYHSFEAVNPDNEAQDTWGPLDTTGKEIAELEQELALMKAVRPSQQEIDDKDILIASMTEGAEKLVEENASLKKRVAELEIYSELYATRYTAGFKAGMERAGYIYGITTPLWLEHKNW